MVISGGIKERFISLEKEPRVKRELLMLVDIKRKSRVQYVACYSKER